MNGQNTIEEILEDIGDTQYEISILKRIIRESSKDIQEKEKFIEYLQNYLSQLKKSKENKL